jgi:hypothetical protein
MTISERTRAGRRRLTRHAYELARSGQYENAEAVISEIRDHKDFDRPSHEAGVFRSALGAICDVANGKRNGRFPTLSRLRRLAQQTAIAA